MIGVRTVSNVMRHFNCTAESAHRFTDLRDEGYGAEQAALMAGLIDPPEWGDKQGQKDLHEVRGIYLPKELHKEVREMARQLAKIKETK